MKLLFATTNPAKIKAYQKDLKEKNVELLTLNDIDVDLNVLEDGKDALENAYIKAKAYYEVTKIPTIGMDNTLFLENVSDEDQPGVYVRRVKGKVLNDEEMLEYYTNLVKKYGDKLMAKWVYGMVFYSDNMIKEFTWCNEDFYFVDTPSEKRNVGYPLDSISVVPSLNKYFVELTKEEKEKVNAENSKDDVINFIIRSLEETNLVENVDN